MTDEEKFFIGKEESYEKNKDDTIYKNIVNIICNLSSIRELQMYLIWAETIRKESYNDNFKHDERFKYIFGGCLIFATYLHFKYPETEIYYVATGRSHWIIKYKGLFFDASCPFGQENPLNIWYINQQNLQKVSLKSMRCKKIKNTVESYKQLWDLFLSNAVKIEKYHPYVNI